MQEGGRAKANRDMTTILERNGNKMTKPQNALRFRWTDTEGEGPIEPVAIENE